MKLMNGKANLDYHVIPYHEYLRRIRITFGNSDSKEFLLAMLYNEVTA